MVMAIAFMRSFGGVLETWNWIVNDTMHCKRRKIFQLLMCGQHDDWVEKGISYFLIFFCKPAALGGL